MACSGLIKCHFSKLLSPPVTFNHKNAFMVSGHRFLWAWLNIIFNRVDESRIEEVGPDRACAEWLLRCGACVKWSKFQSWTKDYNSLPVTGGKLYKIEEVDATDSAIMHVGFPHFKGCKYIRKIVFHKATYIDDDCLSQLRYLRESLEELQVTSCGNITADGLQHLKLLNNLKSLIIYDFPLIKDKDAVLLKLQNALPQCTIDFPYAQA